MMFIGKVILVNIRYSLELKLKAFERFKSVKPNMKAYGRTFYHFINVFSDRDSLTILSSFFRSLEIFANQNKCLTIAGEQ